MKYFNTGVLMNRVGSIAQGTFVNYRREGFRLACQKRVMNTNPPFKGLRDVCFSDTQVNQSNVKEVNTDSRTPLFSYTKLDAIFRQDEIKYAGPIKVLETLIANYYAKLPLPGEKIEFLEPVSVPDEIVLSHNMCFLAAGTRLLKNKDTSKYKIKTSFNDIGSFGLRDITIDPLFIMRNSDLIEGMGGVPEILNTANHNALSQRLLLKKLKHLVWDLGSNEVIALISNLDCSYESSIDEIKKGNISSNNSINVGKIRAFLG